MQASLQRRAAAWGPAARAPAAQRVFRRGRFTIRAFASDGARPLKVMIAGAPAAGKGTQCAKIVDKYKLVHISVGDLLREEVKQGTPAGKKAHEFMDRGALVPDEVVVEMVQHRLSQPDVQEHGWLLDGYPRSASQAEAIEKEGIKPDVFLLIEVPSEKIVERVVGRRMDPETGEIYHLQYKPPPKEIEGRLIQRSDDTEEKVKARLETHYSNVDSVIGFYRDQCVEIDGQRSMEAVFGDIAAALDDAKNKLTDPVEIFCADNPSELECKVFDE